MKLINLYMSLNFIINKYIRSSRTEFYKYIQELKAERIIVIISHDQVIKEIADFTIEIGSKFDNNDEEATNKIVERV